MVPKNQHHAKLLWQHFYLETFVKKIISAVLACTYMHLHGMEQGGDFSNGHDIISTINKDVLGLIFNQFHDLRDLRNIGLTSKKMHHHAFLRLQKIATSKYTSLQDRLQVLRINYDMNRPSDVTLFLQNYEKIRLVTIITLFKILRSRHSNPQWINELKLVELHKMLEFKTVELLYNHINEKIDFEFPDIVESLLRYSDNGCLLEGEDLQLLLRIMSDSGHPADLFFEFFLMKRFPTLKVWKTLLKTPESGASLFSVILESIDLPRMRARELHQWTGNAVRRDDKRGTYVGVEGALIKHILLYPLHKEDANIVHLENIVPLETNMNLLVQNRDILDVKKQILYALAQAGMNISSFNFSLEVLHLALASPGVSDEVKKLTKELWAYFQELVREQQLH